MMMIGESDFECSFFVVRHTSLEKEEQIFKPQTLNPNKKNPNARLLLKRLLKDHPKKTKGVDDRGFFVADERRGRRGRRRRQRI